jgi:hypothetical protein
VKGWLFFIELSQDQDKSFLNLMMSYLPPGEAGAIRFLW